MGVGKGVLLRRVLPLRGKNQPLTRTSCGVLPLRGKMLGWKRGQINYFIYFRASLGTSLSPAPSVRVLGLQPKSWGRNRGIFPLRGGFCPFGAKLFFLFLWSILAFTSALRAEKCPSGTFGLWCRCFLAPSALKSLLPLRGKNVVGRKGISSFRPLRGLNVVFL